MRRERSSPPEAGEARPKILLLELCERLSPKGVGFLTRRLGRAPLIGFADPQRDEQGRIIWRPYTQQPQPVEGRK